MNPELPIRLSRENGVAVLSLCRPDLRNAVTPQWVAALQSHADSLHDDAELRAVLLMSEGPMFCIGADVKRMAEHLADLPAYVDSLIAPAHAALLRLLSLPVPVVGLLRGTAAGGGASLALACDVLVAARSARLVLAYPQLGTTPDLGLSHSLTERLGPQRALQLFLTSDSISMDDAESMGLVCRVFDDEAAEAEAKALVERLADLPSASAKTLFKPRGPEALASRLDEERASFLRCASTPAFRQRVSEFAGRRR